MYNGENEKFFLARARKLKSQWAEALHISSQTLNNKTSGQTEFDSSEILVSQEFLGLTDQERDDTFLHA